MELGPLRHGDLYHTGFVVHDLESAKDEVAAELGVTWHEGGGKVWMHTDEGSQKVRTSYVLSREGPHHVELVQSIDDTLWIPDPDGHPHHVGYWVEDVAAVSAELTRRGSARIASVSVGDAPPMCAYHRTKGGLCVEIVSTAMRPVLFPPS